jgi:hypothetical protein
VERHAIWELDVGQLRTVTIMHKGFGVQVTMRSADDRERWAQPMVVVAKDARDAELIAAALAGGTADARTLRELTDDEVREYGLNLNAHGHAKTLPALKF